MKATEKVAFEQTSKSVGFAECRVVSINPTKSQLNKLLGKEDADDDKEIEYVSEKDGVDRIRIAFWLEEVKNKRLFSHNFLLSKEYKLNNAADKVQIINQMGDTTWCPFIKNGEDITDEVDYSTMLDWFKEFQDKEKNKIADKTFKKAYRGEEELYTFIKAWQNGANYFPATKEDCENTVLIEDVDKFFSGNVKELSGLIDSLWCKNSFIVLTGVETNKDDATKQYQKIFNGGYLPGNFMKFINNGCTFPTAWSKKTWDKFVAKVEDQYGFKAFYKLEPLQDYNPEEDINTKDEPTSPTEASY